MLLSGKMRNQTVPTCNAQAVHRLLASLAGAPHEYARTSLRRHLNGGPETVYSSEAIRAQSARSKSTWRIIESEGLEKMVEVSLDEQEKQWVVALSRMWPVAVAAVCQT